LGSDLVFGFRVILRQIEQAKRRAGAIARTLRPRDPVAFESRLRLDS
jgi:hypothetical protein